jgi:hypothetical protein
MKDRLYFRFEGAPREMCCLANDVEINIAVMWKGKWRDSIFWPDCYHRRVKGGVVCKCCEADGKKGFFPSYEALWKDHLFDPLKDWINDEMAPAKSLGIYGGKGGTWAKLERSARPRKSEYFRAALRFNHKTAPAKSQNE